MWVRNETGEYYIGKHGGTPYSDRYIASGLAFKRAFRKYGKESFTYHVLYEGEKYHQVETNLIILFDACNDTLSYNLSHIHNDTVIHGVETRKKMSENNALKGKKVSPEVRKKIAEIIQSIGLVKNSPKIIVRKYQNLIRIEFYQLKLR
jgi:hypothetical protein